MGEVNAVTLQHEKRIHGVEIKLEHVETKTSENLINIKSTLSDIYKLLTEIFAEQKVMIKQISDNAFVIKEINEDKTIEKANNANRLTSTIVKSIYAIGVMVIGGALARLMWYGIGKMLGL